MESSETAATAKTDWYLPGVHVYVFERENVYVHAWMHVYLKDCVSVGMYACAFFKKGHYFWKWRPFLGHSAEVRTSFWGANEKRRDSVWVSEQNWSLPEELGGTCRSETQRSHFGNCHWMYAVNGTIRNPAYTWDEPLNNHARWPFLSSSRWSSD